MALIQCKECGKQVSSLAQSCPQCGTIINDKLAITQQKVTGTVKQLNTMFEDQIRHIEILKLTGKGIVIIGIIIAIYTAYIILNYCPPIYSTFNIVLIAFVISILIFILNFTVGSILIAIAHILLFLQSINEKLGKK